MKLLKCLGLCGLLALPPVYGKSSGFLTLGPTLFFHFGKRKVEKSIGIEAAFWLASENMEGNQIPAGVKIGFEKYEDIRRTYLALQSGVPGIAGIIVAGGSLGLVYESQDRLGFFGYQGELWGNYLAGFNLRFRKVQENSTLNYGLYAKIPIPLFGYCTKDVCLFDDANQVVPQ